MGVVTLSAAYGAGGPEIGPAVAERLGLPFHDRVIPVKVAGRLGVPDAVFLGRDLGQRDGTEDEKGNTWAS